MTYKGHIRNRAVVLDEPLSLPEGAQVTVDVRIADAPPLAGPSLFTDPWAAVENEIQAFPQKTEALIAQELIPPTPAAIQRTSPLLASLRTQNLPPPSRTLPNGDGGIRLEWIDSARREIVRTIDISAEGNVELTEFTNNRLQSRRQIN